MIFDGNWTSSNEKLKLPIKVKRCIIQKPSTLAENLFFWKHIFLILRAFHHRCECCECCVKFSVFFSIFHQYMKTISWLRTPLWNIVVSQRFCSKNISCQVKEINMNLFQPYENSSCLLLSWGTEDREKVYAMHHNRNTQ